MRQDSRNVSSLEVTLNGSQIEIDPIGNGTRPFDDVKVLLVKGQDGVGSPYTDTPSMDGTGDAGSSDLYSRGDHVHPSDTSRQPTTLTTPITINGTEQTTVEGALGTIPTAMFKGSDYVTAGRAAGTTAGASSTAEGSGVTSSAQYTHAEGLQTAATYKAAHAEGEDSTASGRDAHAEGRGTTASQAQAHAEGLNTTAGHTAAHAEGNTTQTGNNYQHVQGKYNVGKSTTAFEVGNGTSNNARSNALELDWDGNLTVAGTIEDSSGISLSDCQLMALSSAITIGGTAQTTVEGALNGLNNAKVATTDLPTATVGNANELNTASPTASATSYIKRQTSGNLERLKKIVGASVVFNQQIPNGNFESTSNWSRDGITEANFTVSNNVASITTASSDGSFRGIYSSREIPFVKDHKYLISAEFKCTAANYIATAYAGNNSHRILRTEYSRITMTDADTWYKHTKVLNAENSFDVQSNSNFRVGLIGKAISSSTTLSVRNVNLIDLTAMFGSTIADYIYTLEQTEAGSGIAWLESYGFDFSTYHAYDAGSIQSVCVSGKKNESTERSVTYPLSPTQLRGLFKLNSNTLYADGDEYTADGVEKVKYGYRAYQSGDESLANAITNGTNTVYKLTTPTTAQLTPYDEYQTIYPNGTEEFIDGLTRDFTVPVYNDIETFVSNSKRIIAEDDVFDGYGNWLRKKADLDEIVALLGDDESGNTKASRAYSVNEFFYKDGAVFKVTASIASGATFTVGTNCTQTTIFAVLTALLNA